VCSGAALTAARDDYQNVARERQIRETLPAAWNRLVDDEDELLLELIADSVESLCGYKPDPDTVAGFLKKHSSELRHEAKPAPTHTAARRPAPRVPSANTKGPTAVPVGFQLLGRVTECHNIRSVLVSALEALSERDPEFLDRFIALPKHGRTRRYVARTPAELYPDRPDLTAEHSHQLKSGYWLGINISGRQVERILEIACQATDLRYGVDLIVKVG
jgi:predicted type IV restriction endonuclease